MEKLKQLKPGGPRTLGFPLPGRWQLLGRPSFDSRAINKLVLFSFFTLCYNHTVCLSFLLCRLRVANSSQSCLSPWVHPPHDWHFTVLSERNEGMQTGVHLGRGVP